MGTHIEEPVGELVRSAQPRDRVTYILGVSEIKPSDLMSFLQDTETLSTISHRIIYKAFKDVKKVVFILSNTVQEFEYEASSAFQSKQNFYSIGPVSEPAGLANIAIKKSLWHESDFGWFEMV